MKMKRRILALALAAALVLALTGCQAALSGLAQRILGTSSAVEEADTTRWAELTADPLMITGIADTSVKYASATANGSLYAVFNGIWSRQTSYFTVPGGTLTITACGTVEGPTKRFKIAVWQKVDGGAQYVDGSTGYITADGQNYRYTVTGLDPAASYRLTISYDSSRYYLYGLLQAEGVAG